MPQLEDPCLPPRHRSVREIGAMCVVFSALLAIIFYTLPDAGKDIEETNYCPQEKAIYTEGKYANSSIFYTDEYLNFSVGALQGAIQVPSVSYDDMSLDPTEDSRFESFSKLHEFLFSKFPLTGKHVELVNSYGLLYTFQGSNSALKPLVLMAHQDVVPVPEATLDQWDYPPFEAHFDGEWMYGRGTADTKDSLVGILEATEALLKQEWVPERTVLLSFGFDEECSGVRGASSLSRTIFDRYGPQGVDMIVDEGFGIPKMYDSLVAWVTVGEKGYLDLAVTLNTPGGHSSIPPDHTGIGIMSLLVEQLERHPFKPELGEINPTLDLYRCIAENAPGMDNDLRRTILDIDAGDHREKLINYLSEQPLQKYLVRTSQAVDVMQGGVKINALPEQVSLKVNHRIDPTSSTTAVTERFEHFILEIAREFNLGVESHGETLLEPTEHGMFNLTTTHRLEPSPISPHEGRHWHLVSGTLRAIMENAPFDLPSDNLVVGPSLFTANTDTRYYWDLCRAIYRFKPVLAVDSVNFHTVNERIRFRSHILSVAWYYEFIQNAAN